MEVDLVRIDNFDVESHRVQPRNTTHFKVAHSLHTTESSSLVWVLVEQLTGPPSMALSINYAFASNCEISAVSKVEHIIVISSTTYAF